MVTLGLMGCLGGDLNMIINRYDATTNPENKMSPTSAWFTPSTGLIFFEYSIQAGMSSAQPQAEAVSLKFWLVFVYFYNFHFMPWSLSSFEGVFHWS